MIKKITFYISIVFFTLLISCNLKTKKNTTFFGGKIINPRSKNVILYFSDKVKDTLFLDTENKFMVAYKSLKEGLYHFKHGNEYQYVYLEPNDSLMLRLNTWNFDESIVFAGKGAERNNILIDCFLEEERETKIFYSLYQLKPEAFKIKVDSILNLKLETYNNYVENHSNETDGFNEILKASLTYPTYSKIEKYPIKHAYYSNLDSFPKFDTDFYDYRKEANTNYSALMYYSPYSKYITNYLYNEAYSLGHNPKTNDYTPEFTIDLLKIINSKIKSESSKNALLKQTIIGHFYKKSSCKINKKSFDTFFELSTNKDDKNQIKKLVNDINTLPLNKEIENFKITNYNNTQKSIREVIKNKNALLLFWTPEYITKSYIVSRIKYLSKTYPNINFIQIRTDGIYNDRIKGLDIKNQFYIDAKNNAHHFLTSKMPRSVLVNKKGIIVNGYASISSNNLNSYLKDLNKK